MNKIDPSRDSSRLHIKQFSIVNSFKRRFLRRNAQRRRIVRWGLLVGNFAVLGIVLGLVAANPNNDKISSKQALNQTTTVSAAAGAIDQLSSVDIAVNVARLSGLYESTSVANKADTVNASLSIKSASDNVVAKTQIVSTGQKSVKDIVTYTTKEGDTLSSLATQFGISTDSIRFSNGLALTNTLVANKVLTIPPVTGLVYEVKAGDTVESLAARFTTDKDQIIAFNDAEVNGLKVGSKIVLPGGTQPVVTARATYYGGAPRSGFAFGNTPQYGYNGYDYGYCTWWVAVRRAQSGQPLPANLGNASTWKVLAARAGLGVGSKPSVGAVIWTPPKDYYGHVGYVEKVNDDQSVEITEMNTAGWAKVSRKTLTAEQAANFSYIY